MLQKIGFLFFVLPLLVGSCKNGKEDHVIHENSSYYTCPMHPSVQNNAPGSCSVCNMSLIKVKKSEGSHEEHKGNFITLDKRQQLLAGIETDTAKFRKIFSNSTLVGTVAIDEEQVVMISSRVKGRIEKLHFRTSGEYIRKGNPVYSIYSEELFSDTKEFLELSEKRKEGKITGKLIDDMFKAAKNKLLLWGLTDDQILQLENSKTASPQVTFYAQAEGYVTEVSIKEGIYVNEGTSIIKLAGLQQVWVEAQAYSNENVKDNNLFHVFSETSPGEIYIGRLVFTNPRVEEGRKVQLLRIKVNNAKGKLIPGMMVYVNPEKMTQPVLSVAKSAVLLEKMKTLWVKTNENTFEQRMVETGADNKYFIEILSGIKEGELIVTSGAYLISSEFILKSGSEKRHKH